MFTQYGPGVDNSIWVNGYQLQRWLKDHGWDLTILPGYSDNLLKLLQKARGLPRLYSTFVSPFIRRRQIRIAAREADIVIVHKSITSINSKPFLEKYLRSLHKRIIFNFDDAVNEAGVPYLDERIKLADAVWVGHPLLAEYSKKYCSKVHIIESAVDTDRYNKNDDYQLNNPPIILWIGTPYGLRYLSILEKPLSRLAEQEEFVFQIICRERFSFASRIKQEWLPFDYDKEVSYLHNCDVAVMPLFDEPYERAKENYKVKMYLSCGLPTICSPVGINNKFIKDGENGFLADTSDSWANRLLLLLKDQELRQRFGGAGRKYILKNYTIPVIGNQLLNLFNSMF